MLPPHLQTPDTLIRAWDGVSAFVTNQYGPSGVALDWGPEAEFCYQWVRNGLGQINYIKNAVPNTPLAQDAGQDWSPLSAGKLFAGMETTIATALATLTNPNVLLVGWAEGEADAQVSAYATAYQANLAALIVAIRARWGNSRTRILIGRLSNTPLFNNPLFGTTIRAAQDANDSITTPVIDTDSYPRQPDNLHYTTVGDVQYGSDMFNAFMKQASGQYTIIAP